MSPGKEPVRQLGQKVPLAGFEPAAVAAHHDVPDRERVPDVARASRAELNKTRQLVHHPEAPLALDTFHDALEGLVLAEVDLGENGDEPSGLSIGPASR